MRSLTSCFKWAMSPLNNSTYNEQTFILISPVPSKQLLPLLSNYKCSCSIKYSPQRLNFILYCLSFLKSHRSLSKKKILCKIKWYAFNDKDNGLGNKYTCKNCFFFWLLRLKLKKLKTSNAWRVHNSFLCSNILNVQQYAVSLMHSFQQHL